MFNDFALNCVIAHVYSKKVGLLPLVPGSDLISCVAPNIIVFQTSCLTKHSHWRQVTAYKWCILIFFGLSRSTIPHLGASDSFVIPSNDVSRPTCTLRRCVCHQPADFCTICYGCRRFSNGRQTAEHLVNGHNFLRAPLATVPEQDNNRQLIYFLPNRPPGVAMCVFLRRILLPVPVACNTK